MKKSKRDIEMRFGQFLINKGIISAADFYDALNIQMKQKIPVGELALKKNVLKETQVIDVLKNQIHTADTFGETAIKLGYLTEKQVDDLLYFQESYISDIRSILFSQKIIDENILVKEFEEFKKQVDG